MHHRIMAQRQLEAQNGIVDTAAALAKKYAIGPPAVVNERLPDIAQLLRWESISTFLADLLNAPETNEVHKLRAEVDRLQTIIDKSTADIGDEMATKLLDDTDDKPKRPRKEAK